ncbi:HopJ type III effector protein [Mucilaginibacter sp. cycad4]|uniref:HopJ type III effector protein n=1 Tax=Mucilaginibacter sp. cycad4 TaxID=3342096 RepID=UPI002AAA6FCE|nr:HopJ type III effector protein [Mucilaginibacter gossypii]WPV02054.1 HopJ type III effector protein [Mucilaginibacter gossypii]
MKEQLADLITALKEGTVTFNEVIEFIANYYDHQPTAFKNGNIYNETTQNQGSARVFAFAQINNLSEPDTLYLFAEHYRAVLANPDSTDHQNIRQFMAYGWPGITFEGEALVLKPGQV